MRVLYTYYPSGGCPVVYLAPPAKNKTRSPKTEDTKYTDNVYRYRRHPRKYRSSVCNMFQFLI